MNYRIYLNGVLAASFFSKAADCNFEPAVGIAVRGVRTAGDVTEVNIDVPASAIEAAKIYGRGLTQEEILLVQSAKRIQAIKLVRDRLHIPLKDAKDLVDVAWDAWQRTQVPDAVTGTSTP